MPKKILFVEDDEGFYNIFSVPLKMKGYDVLRVSDGSSAVDKVIVEKPDLVLLDIVLPGTSGLDVLKELREREETKSVFVVMLTNFGNDENISKAMEYGANDYLMKYNIVPSELPDKIASFLGEDPNFNIKVTEL
ncbi:MAG TPA: response regulator [bacterium]|jgi:two-component system alkaline phosphatase synthesis response regulator PhoP|nr:response regulator [Patescibacteria group bacterium]HOS88422.1 response regulator [bacterium]HQG58614.1 response regulator [bacterium]HQG79173.1 response regulator [bacterium]HQK41560.1 response regulator [bacterium]